ncbi:MAG: GEVED domain-containing protein [Saprospiraceae bacterium]|nr:GEVED domain-containing protein [Saprospiraceae bacterium]
MNTNKPMLTVGVAVCFILLLHYPFLQMTARYGQLANHAIRQFFALHSDNPYQGDKARNDQAAHELYSFPGAEKSGTTQSPLMCTKLSETHSVSGCFLKDTLQLAIVRFEVNWDPTLENPAINNKSDVITIKMAGQTQTIDPGKSSLTDVGLKPPFAVGFEVPADGSTLTAQIYTGASFAASTCAIEVTGILIPTGAGCGQSSEGGASTGPKCEFGQLGGIVWNDDNSDGQYQANETKGVSGVIVEAYNAVGTRVDTTVTGGSGRFILTNVDSSDYPVRLQFLKLPIGTLLPYQSDVRFVQHPSCYVNFAIYKPAASPPPAVSSGAGTPFATTCFVEGSRLSTNDPKDPMEIIVGSYVGNFRTKRDSALQTQIDKLAVKSEAGSVWGLAYNPTKNVLFSSAFLKRHSDLGPLGLGGIYKTDLSNPASPATTTFIDLDNFADLGTIGNFGKTGSRKYNDKNGNNVFDPGEPSWDQEAWAKVAKVGIGDVDISEDFNTLYVMNLYQKKIIKVDITSFNQNGTLPGASQVSSLPDYLPVSCGAATSRPFALKIYQGKLYLGLVCDGFPAYIEVQSFNFETQTWSVELNKTNFNYFRSEQSTGATRPFWQAWNDDYDPRDVADGGNLGNNDIYGSHQAILSDIEFDNDGNMLLGILDREGHQVGYGNYGPDTTQTLFIYTYCAGDILRAHKSTTGYVLEFDPGQSLQGGVFKEFFVEGSFHKEASNGGVAYDAASNSMIISAMDPFSVISGGLIKFNATTGQRLGALELYRGQSVGGAPGTVGFNGKGAGIGDVELLAASAAPPPSGILQLGNHAWVDLDGDGVQGPDEIPLPGLEVSLFKKVGSNFTYIARTITDASGSYAFTGIGAPHEYWVSTSGVDSLIMDMEYKIVFGYNGETSASQVAGTTITVGGINHTLTTANTGEGKNMDMNDSDATFMSIAGGSFPSINVLVDTNIINHTFDVGFTSSGYEGIGNFVWLDTDFDGEQDPGEIGVQGVKVNLHPCVDSVPGAAIIEFMRTTDQFGQYRMAEVPLGEYALSFDYSMVSGNDTLRFTMPDINFNLQKSNDSEVLIPADYYAQSTPVQIGFTACFHWDPEEGTGYNPTYDAGLISTDNLIDPTGYVYCEGNGEILPGGLLTVSGPGNVYMVHDASLGYYQYYVDAVGVYTMTLTNPSGYVRSVLCPGLTDTLDAPVSVQINNPYSVGSDDLDSDGFLDDYTCTTNQLYHYMLLEPGDFIINNNFPMACSDLGDLPSPYPTVYDESGPRHAILRNPLLYLGSIVDIELDGQPDTMAGMMGGGDDGLLPELDDEDGLLSPKVLVVTVPNEIKIQVNNKTNTTAKLTVFADLNKDGDFFDAGEMESETVSAGYMGPVSVYFTPSINAPIGEKTGLRIRLTTDNIMTHTGFASDGEIEDYMFTFAGFDYGDLPDSYNTFGSDNPPSHVVSESLKLGASVDAESDGIADAMAGSMGAGDDGDGGLITFGTSMPAGDDEDGVMLAAPMIPGGVSSFMVTAMNMTTSSAVLQAWVDFNGNGSFETGEQLTSGSFAPSGAVVPVGGLNGAKLTFNVPSGATYYQGNAMVRFRLSPGGGLSGNSQTGSSPIGEIEDYKFPLSKLGNLVWEDYNHDGLQNSGEPGIDSVMVALTWAGPDGDINTTSDNADFMTKTGPQGGFQKGEYYFCGLTPGTYKLKFFAPDDMIATKVNTGSQVVGGVTDSDPSSSGVDFNILMSMEVFTVGCAPCQPVYEDGNGDSSPSPALGFPDNQVDETHDAGFWRPCCSDLMNYCCPQNNK